MENKKISRNIRDKAKQPVKPKREPQQQLVEKDKNKLRAIIVVN